MIEAVKSFSELAAEIKGVKTPERLRRTKGWYVALRYSDLLIQARSFSGLEVFIKQSPCRREVDFLCGIYAQLEHAWDVFTSGGHGDASIDVTKTALRHIVAILPPPEGSTNDLKHVEVWRDAIAEQFRLQAGSTTVSPAEPKKRSRLAVFEKNKTYSYHIAYRTHPRQATSTDLLSEG